MKNLSLKSFTFLSFIAFTMLFTANVAFAQEAPNAAPTKTEAPVGNSSKVIIGIAVPKASFSEGVDNAQMAASLREVIAGYFQGTEIEIVALEARLPQAITAEAEEKNCDYILQTAVTQKKGGSGFGMFKQIAPVLSSVAPMAGVSGSTAGIVAGQVAQTAIISAAQMSATTKSKDVFTLDYSLIATEGGAVKNTNSLKAKAKADGEDVLSPMLEKMAEAILTAAK